MLRVSALALFFFFFFKQKTAYEIMPSLVGSEMCIRDRLPTDGAEERTARRAHGPNLTQRGRRERGSAVVLVSGGLHDRGKKTLDRRAAGRDHAGDHVGGECARGGPRRRTGDRGRRRGRRDPRACLL